VDCVTVKTAGNDDFSTKQESDQRLRAAGKWALSLREQSRVFHQMRNPASSERDDVQSAPAGRRPARLVVNSAELGLLREQLARLHLASSVARRLQVVVLTAEGLGASEIAGRLALSRFHVSRIRGRFRRGGLEALLDRGRRGRRSSVSAEVIGQVLDTAARPPPAGLSRWSLRRLARAHGLSHSSVYRILRAHGVAPYGPGR
jgi:transposase